MLEFVVDVDPLALRRPVQAMAWLSITPRHLDRAATHLARHSDIAFVAATTGRSNLYVFLLTSSVPALHRVLTDTVAPLPGLQSIETTISIRRVKRRPVGFS